MSTEAKAESLEDFEAFLQPNFEKLGFANDLLLATNDGNETELDIATAVKKLKFDIDECEKRMSTIASKSHESLIANFSQVEVAKALMDSKINPSIAKVNTSFQRIKNEIIRPYDNCLRINDALRKIHHTVGLLRGASSFIFLIQQVEELEQSIDDPQNFNSHKDLVRLVKLHHQISILYDNEAKGSENLSSHSRNPSLLTIKLVRDYRSIQSSKKANLKLRCNKFINDELSHSSSFNEQNLPLQFNLVALFLLDHHDLISLLEKSAIGKQIQSSSSQLTRSLQSPRNFSTVLKDVIDNSNSFLTTLSGIFSNCDVTNALGTNADSNSKNLLDFLLENLKTKSINQYYWHALAFRFKKSVVATMARGGPISQNLRSNIEAIERSVNSAFSEEKDIFLDAVSIINQE